MSPRNKRQSSLWAQLRFAMTVRQIDGRDITPHEELLRDKLTVILIERDLAEAEQRRAA